MALAKYSGHFHVVRTRRRTRKGSDIFQYLLVLADQIGENRGAQAFARDWSRLMGLPLENIHWSMDATVTPERLHESTPKELIIVGQYRSLAQKKAILRVTNRDNAPAVLLCPEEPCGLTRVLLLDQIDRPTDWLVNMAARLGPFFPEGLVILTLARSQRLGQVRQQEVREKLHELDCLVDFDLLVSHDLRAIRSVAGWRQCSLMVLQRLPQNLWNRLWGDPIEDILKTPGLPPMLALTNHAGVSQANHSAGTWDSMPQPATSE